MNTQTLIEIMENLDPTNKNEAESFLQACTAYVEKMQAWMITVSDKYGIDLTSTETSEGQILLSKDQQLSSVIAADLYYQFSFLNRKIDIDKVNILASTYPEHQSLKLFHNAVCYYGMSLQSFLHDAEGGVMSINAHSIYAQNRTGSVMGQLISQVIIPGIRQITADYTGSFTGEAPKQLRGLFFQKAHSTLAKSIEEDMLKIFFIENYQPYMIENPVENTISNEVFQNKNAVLMKAYDELVMNQMKKINEEYNRFVDDYKRKTGHKKIDFIMQDKVFGSLERQMREQETQEERGLKKQVESLPASEENKKRIEIINNREYSDNTKKCFNDLCCCLSYLKEHLEKEKSVELSGKLTATILSPLEEHGFHLTFKNTKTFQKI